MLEFESIRWGFVVFLGPAGELSPAGVRGGRGFRRGLGRASALLRPKLDPLLTNSSYYAQMLTVPTDQIRQAMETSSPFQETTFAAASAYLLPTHDYTLVGNVQSHTKFSLAQDGKVWLANFSIYSPTDQGADVTGGQEPGVLLFNPQEVLSTWPKRGNFTAYKTSILGRYTRAVVVGAWDTPTQHGFVSVSTCGTSYCFTDVPVPYCNTVGSSTRVRGSTQTLTAVPNTRRGVAKQPYNTAELLLRLEEHTAAATSVGSGLPPRYFAVQGCVTAGSPVDLAARNGSSGDQVYIILV